jgi:phytoene synthase
MPAPTLEQSLDHCRGSISRGSKSFSLAARLFPTRMRDAAFFVYGWCRFCDDEIDGHASEGAEKLAARVESLRARTLSALSGAAASEPEFVAFGYVARRYGMPDHYPLELIEGMEMDARGESYPDLAALELYCYRVAGTVGLMMTHVMGVTDETALRNACDLGIAMQLTNICRDVREDARLGRVYLPADWIRAHGESGTVIRLLDRADSKYRSGRSGIRALPLSAAFAIAAAARIYREIGVLVRARGWELRAVVPTWRKLVCVLLAAGEVAASIPSRIFFRRPLVPIRQIWRHS